MRAPREARPSGLVARTTALLLTRRIDFSSAHRLRRADWSDARNTSVFGPEGDTTSGHNYVLEVTLSGEADRETGMLIDLKDLKAILETEVAERFDHRNLNEDTPYFRDRAPTPENFARLIFDLLDSSLPAGLLHEVRLSPTEDLTVEVSR